MLALAPRPEEDNDDMLVSSIDSVQNMQPAPNLTRQCLVALTAG
jgi:hypothetical protein